MQTRSPDLSGVQYSPDFEFPSLLTPGLSKQMGEKVHGGSLNRYELDLVRNSLERDLLNEVEAYRKWDKIIQ